MLWASHLAWDLDRGKWAQSWGLTKQPHLEECVIVHRLDGVYAMQPSLWGFHSRTKFFFCLQEPRTEQLLRKRAIKHREKCCVCEGIVFLRGEGSQWGSEFIGLAKLGSQLTWVLPRLPSNLWSFCLSLLSREIGMTGICNCVCSWVYYHQWLLRLICLR